MKSLIRLILSLLISASIRGSADDEPGFGGQPAQGDVVQARHAANLEAFADQADVLVLHGLVANRKTRQVEVLVETTQVAGNSAAEYLVVHTGSSHGYEAIFWSHAKPSDIHKALAFIGIKAGYPIDPSRHQFWSKGERVIVSVVSKDGMDVRLEELVFDTETEKAMPKTGFIFTGSITVPDPKNPAHELYIADTYDPRSIIPNYNEPGSVMDIPWDASKGQFYESHVVNPEYRLEGNTLFTLRLEPELAAGETRITQLRLLVKGQEFQLLAEDGTVLNADPSFPAVLQACQPIIRSGKEIYVSTRFDDEMPLYIIQAVARVLVMLDMREGLRQEPPETGRLFYQSFVPDLRWQTPENRMVQPWELHLEKRAGKLSGNMVIHDETWLRGESKPALSKRSYPISHGADIRERLDQEDTERRQNKKRPTPAVLLIYLPADLSYGELLAFIKPAMTTHNAVHLYLQEPTTAPEQ